MSLDSETCSENGFLSAINESLLDKAWQRVRSRGDAPGIDGIDLPIFESDLSANLGALLSDLKSGNYCPQAYRSVDIPKEDGGYRRIVIATLRDRVLQTAAAFVLQPMIEPLLLSCCYAYRKGIGVQDALLKVAQLRDTGQPFVLRADIERFFDSVRHPILFSLLRRIGICEEWIGMIGKWLAARILPQDQHSTDLIGLPQGLPISPLLANLYLTDFDRSLTDSGWSLVRYADDIAVCCNSPESAEQASEEADKALSLLCLRLSSTKTRVEIFQKGFIFLGAKFVGKDLIPALPHPYEADFTPRPLQSTRRPRTQSIPHPLLRTLYIQDIQEQGSYLARRHDRLVVLHGKNTLVDLPAHYVDQIFIFGRVHISSAATSFCLYRNIPIHLFTSHAKYNGVIRRLDNSDVHLRRAQFAKSEDPSERLGFSQAIVEAKICACRGLLMHHARNHPDVDLSPEIESPLRSLSRAGESDNLARLRGIEGNAAAVYYRGFAKCSRGALSFTHRVRRPPTDPVNGLLSFAYTMDLFLPVRDSGHFQSVRGGLDGGESGIGNPGETIDRGDLRETEHPTRPVDPSCGSGLVHGLEMRGDVAGRPGRDQNPQSSARVQRQLLFGEPVQDLEILPGISETIRLHGRCAIILSGVFCVVQYRTSSFRDRLADPGDGAFGPGRDGAGGTATGVGGSLSRASGTICSRNPGGVRTTGSGLDQSSTPTECTTTITH